MAGRSFAGEVLKLRQGAGTTFHGEGIVAVTKALLQSGVAYVGGYQEAPISHLMDVLGDAHEILTELSAPSVPCSFLTQPQGTSNRCPLNSSAHRQTMKIMQNPGDMPRSGSGGTAG